MPVIVRPEPEPEEEPRGPAEPEPLVEPELDDAGVLVAVARLNTFTNLSVSVEHYCRRFGAPSDAAPWGQWFWQGFEEELVDSYFPGCQQSWLQTTPRRRCCFELPSRFSKANAAQAPTDPGGLNPRSGAQYPAVIFEVNGRLEIEVWVVCFHILMQRSRAWRCHPGWIWLNAPVVG